MIRVWQNYFFSVKFQHKNLVFFESFDIQQIALGL